MNQGVAKPVFIAADHRGFELKNQLLPILTTLGAAKAEDLGPAEYVPEDDFNDAALAVCKKVLENEDARGIIVCGSAIGVAMQANRFKGIRAVAAYSEKLAELGRQHEDANVLCLSADLVGARENTDITRAFLKTDAFEDEKYLRRERKLDEIEIKEEK